MSDLAPGRYCLATCYCGQCPHYEPIKRPAAIAPAEAPRINKTWTEREVETWIDQM